MIVLTLIYEVFGSIAISCGCISAFRIFTAELLVFSVHRASFVRIIGNVRNTCARSTPSTTVPKNNQKQQPTEANLV